MAFVYKPGDRVKVQNPTPDRADHMNRHGTVTGTVAFDPVELLKLVPRRA